LSLSAKFAADGLLGDLPCIGLSATIKTCRHSEGIGAANQCPVSDIFDLDQSGLAALGRKICICPGVQGTNWT
jgi:hypothetical protein